MSAGVLIDTSVWIAHLSGRDPDAASRIASDAILCHEFVVGELVLNVLRRRDPALADLRALPRAPTVPHDEVVAFVRTHRLEGTGIGWVDAHLLASARLAGADLWTYDRSMLDAASRAGIRT